MIVEDVLTIIRDSFHTEDPHGRFMPLYVCHPVDEYLIWVMDTWSLSCAARALHVTLELRQNLFRSRRNSLSQEFYNLVPWKRLSCEHGVCARIDECCYEQRIRDCDVSMGFILPALMSVAMCQLMIVLVC